jgi:hypothetical protein
LFPQILPRFAVIGGAERRPRSKGRAARNRLLCPVAGRLSSVAALSLVPSVADSGRSASALNDPCSRFGGRRPSTRFPPDAPVSVCRSSRRPYFRAADLRTAAGSARSDLADPDPFVADLRRFVVYVSLIEILARRSRSAAPSVSRGRLTVSDPGF